MTKTIKTNIKILLSFVFLGAIIAPGGSVHAAQIENGRIAYINDDKNNSIAINVMNAERSNRLSLTRRV